MTEVKGVMETIKEYLPDLKEATLNQEAGDKGKAPTTHEPSHSHPPLARE